MGTVNECGNSGANGTSNRKGRGKESNGNIDGDNMSDRAKDIRGSSDTEGRDVHKTVNMSIRRYRVTV